MTPQPLPPRPLIGLTTYRKTSVKANPVAVYALMPSYVEAVIAAGGSIWTSSPSFLAAPRIADLTRAATGCA